MENFDALLNDILENPELILQKDLSDEQIFELQKRISPYKNFSSDGLEDPNFKKILIFSYTNLKEEYLKKFLMTSLIGFMFQMKHELEIDNELLKFTNTPYIDRINKILEEANAISNVVAKSSEEGIVESDTEIDTMLKKISDLLQACSDNGKNSTNDMGCLQLAQELDKLNRMKEFFATRRK